MKGSGFVFDSVNLLHYNDDTYFQYAVTAALIYQNIEKDAQRISKIKHFIHRYDWK